MNERNNAQSQPCVSRRAFLAGSMALAAGIALPRLDGQGIFSATPAWAEETSDSSETKIVVVGPTEVGVVCYDVSDPSKLVPVSGCYVLITSRYNNKRVGGTSDDNGKVVLDVADLAEEGDDTGLCAFNGRVEISKDGYRPVIIPLARVVSQTAFVAPTRPYDGLPFCLSMTLNEWDVQYTNPCFITDPSNTEKQTVAVQFWAPQGIEGASLELDDGQGTVQKVGDLTYVGTSGDYVTMQIQGEFLNSSNDVCFDGTKQPKIVFWRSENSNALTTYETNLSIVPKPAPTTTHKTEDKIVTPTAVKNLTPLCVMPEGFIWPFAGSKLECWQPTAPVLFECSPYGFILIGVGYSKTIAKSDDGKFLDASSWKTAPRESVLSQIEKQIDDQFAALDTYREQRACPNDPTKTKTFSHRFTSKYKFDIKAQLFASLEYDWDKQNWKGSLAGVFAGSFNAIWTLQLSLFVFPLFIQVNPYGNAQVSLYLAARGEKDADVLDYEPESRTVGFSLTIGIIVTAGVGIVGFASVACSGSAFISLLTNFQALDGSWHPRFCVGAGASVALVIQFACFKYTMKFVEGNWPTIYDSDNASNSLFSDSEGSTECLLSDELISRFDLESLERRNASTKAGEMPSFEELKNNSVLVTNEELLNSTEFKRTASFAAESLVTITKTPGDCSNLEGLSNDSVDCGYGPDEDPFDEDVPFAQITITPNDPAMPVNDDDLAAQYEYVGTDYTSDVDPAGGNIEVASISDSSIGGIKPTFDNLLFENVNSNPRMRILKTQYGMTVMFRLAIVDVGSGQARPRVVYHVMMSDGSWSTPQAIDFDPQISGVSRDGMYDYDFDVAQADGYDGSNYIFMCVTSGERKDGDNTGFVDAVKARYANLVCLYQSGSSLRVYPYMTCNLSKASSSSTLQDPRVTAYSDPTSIVGTMDFCVMVSLRSRSVSDGGMSGSGRRAVWFGRWEFDDSWNTVFKVDRIAMNSTDLSSVVFPVQLDDDGYTPQVGNAAKVRRMTLVGLGSNRGQITKFEATYSSNEPSRRTYEGIYVTNIASFGDDHKIDKIYRWGTKQGELLATSKIQDPSGQDTSSIFKLTFDPKNEGSVSCTQVGETTGGVAEFVCDPSGKFLFFTENIEGQTGQEYETDEDGRTISPTDAVVENKHYIKAMAYVGGLFTRPFVFAELEHAADWVVAATMSNDYVSFLVDGITDMSKSVSNIYDVRVPLVKCLTPTSFALVEPFAFLGKSCPFTVSVRNDGNLVATSATFNFVDCDTDKVLDSKQVNFGDNVVIAAAAETSDAADADSSTTEGTHYDTEAWEAAGLSELLENPVVTNGGTNVLLPGETELYNINFKIPEIVDGEYWIGEKRVRVEITDIAVITPGDEADLLAASDDDFETYHIPDDECPFDEITVSDEEGVDVSGLQSGEVRVRGSKGGQGGGGGGADGGGSNGDGASGLPDTGDNGSGSLAMTALGAAAGAFAAYSARRTAIERQARQSDD